MTIDGGPREALAALEKARDVLRSIIIDKAAGVHYASAQSACHQINAALGELNALLDAPERYSRVQRLLTERAKMDKAFAACIEERDVLRSAHPEGEPVAMNRRQFEAWVLGREHPTYGWLDKHWLARGDNPETYADPYVQGLWVASQSLYAEQTAQVAVVMPERLPGDDGVCTESHYASGWNACLDELKSLNPSL